MIFDMDKDFNLCEILKGHEGETFYSIKFGDVILYGVYGDKLALVILKYNSICVEANVVDVVNDLFPSKDQRDWNKWIEEQKSKGIKTWDELVKRQEFLTCYVDIDGNGCSTAGSNIEKSALALLKISQLIGTCYGGNVTEWEYPCVDKYIITPTLHIEKVNYKSFKSHIAFHTKEQAEEFLKYPENVQLLKDYFMI